MLKLIPPSLSKVVAQKGLLLQTHSPTILFGAGVAGMIGSTVLACRATLKLESVLDEIENDAKTAKRIYAQDDERYTSKDLKQDLTLIYVRGIGKAAKLYIPAAVLNIISIAALSKSHNILTKRNAALAAAYTAVDRAFHEYRERVVEKYGEDDDLHFRYGSEEHVVTTNAKGKTTHTETRVAPGTPSQYARFFDQLCAPWSVDPEVNLIWLNCQQNYLNQLLTARGHVFLNEAYDTLGMDRTEAGSVVGWLVDDNDVSDNYIDFGIWKGDTKETIAFVNGREGAVLIDFNVDGLIFNRIEKPKEALSWQRG